VSASTVTENGTLPREVTAEQSQETEERELVRARVRVGQVGIGLAGVIALLASAWGGIVPYVGPVLGYGIDGSGSWHWSLAHTVLSLVPGVAGVLLGLFVLAESRGISLGRGRLSLATAGLLLMVCGAWFAIGPLAWPVLSNGTGYFRAGTHLRFLADEVGSSIGVGIILVVCGAFIDGWASRHRPKSMVVTSEPGLLGTSRDGMGRVETRI
jgi:hypothetical protein